MGKSKLKKRGLVRKDKPVKRICICCGIDEVPPGNHRLCKRCQRSGGDEEVYNASGGRNHSVFTEWL